MNVLEGLVLMLTIVEWYYVFIDVLPWVVEFDTYNYRFKIVKRSDK